MNGETFAVVTTDGREHPAVDLETIKRWYLEKSLRDDSLVFSSEAGDWRLLNGFFDTRTWMETFRGRATSNAPSADELLSIAPAGGGYFAELTSLAVPPDADFTTVQHFSERGHMHIDKPVKKSIPGMTALVSLAVFAVFGAIAYVVLVNFVFYEETVSFTNNKDIAALKTQILGKPFSDPSGVKIALPAGWSMISPKMPEVKVQAQDPKMFAANFDKKMYSALEVVPVDGKVDLKAKMSELLQKFRGPFSVIADTEMQLGNYAARKTIFSRKDKSVDAGTTTHLIVAQDKNNLFIYQIWAPTDKYTSLLNDFDATEKALALP
jgi:hypothetical protein